ncbi:Stk1 family PASTA domain-containing Ser/Thr kinase [Bacillus sp. CMF21]|uniref:Stk1 family PASTA domain-containing Ser/Thr kinase n=1 Tax=Metabacillus dongyingensis TaxID=2874282 RepID=UPI001CBD0411|nr:Stk1 family PASTA domain-containing Ser/Thr kinase [Metabacillus dongyingensis]UAL54213.1 Stk1 family PASTA domain-containing Ser/Thr kinase [Metabacillus dongyingensis]USK30533.1 Stk1 family PASTA domain-containing Ser/Thr kinase [Bacillus sp. CMF21]
MLIGKRLSGRYKILRVIGGGGMANVYLARDMILDRDVAMKVLRFDFSNDDEFIKRFRREAQSATSLAHPNIVSIFDVGEEDGIYYIVMEYVEGNTLKQYIQQYAPLHPREALNIMEQIVSAIAHAHENHIVHRDIKPHNILIDPHGNVKVTDFGIAMALSSTTITQTNSVLGSVHYLSPEQARGGMANKKSDIYSLGIVLFELLTGRLPFDGESAISIALKHLQSETPSAKRWNATIPQSVENIILKAMAKDTFHRYESAEEMEEDITSALKPERLNEEKFVIPEDNEATKAIPIITDSNMYEKTDDTLVRPQENIGKEASNKPIKEANKKGKKEKKKKSKAGKIILTIFLLLLVASVAAVTIIPPLLMPKDVEVPDLTGIKYEEAVEQLIADGFVVDDPIHIEDEEIQEGFVVKTKPEAGKTVKEGDTIIIYESSGKEKVELDDYVNRDINRVRDLLVRKGFTNIKVEEEFNEAAAGTILEQDPEPGVEVIPGEDELVLTVSKGPEEFELQDLTGYSEEALNAYIEENDLELVRKDVYSDTVSKGEVISQSPGPSEKVLPGDTLEATISLGPEPMPIQKVKKTIEIPYPPELAGQPAEVSINIDDAEHSISDVYDKFTTTETTTREIEFSIAPDEKAFYQVIIDNRVVKSEIIPYPE